MNENDAAAALLDSWRRKGLVHVTIDDARRLLAERELTAAQRAADEAKQDRAARLGVDWRYLPDDD